MAKKTKQSDLGSTIKAPAASLPSQSRQPRIIGWLVLVAGGVSTWYWYKPLPDSVHQTVNSTDAASWVASDSGPKSLWSDHGLVVPGTSGVFENPIEFQNDNASATSAEANLVGAPKVTLVPWSETHHDLREVLKTERTQGNSGSIDRSESNFIANAPRSSAQDFNASLDSKKTTVGNQNWPDEGYVPPPKAKRRNQAQVTAPIPPFLETGMKSIRTTESDDVSPPNETQKPNHEPVSAPEIIRQPQFIRQPKR